MIQIISIGIIAFLLYSGQMAVYKKLWDKNLTADISFVSKHIFEGQEGTLTEVIENRKRLPLSMLKVKFQTDRHLIFENAKGSRTTDQYYRNDVFQLNRMERLTRTLHFTGSKRGYYTISTMDMVSSDLFMSALYVKVVPVQTFLYVYPRPFDSLEFRQSLQQLNGEVLTKRHLLEDPFEYRGIRDYQPTDDMHSINWKATAKTGEFKVNQKNHTALKSVRVFLNLESRWDDCVEVAIQITAGLCRYFISQGISVSCYGNGADIITHLPISLTASAGTCQLEAVYSALARIDTSQPVIPFCDCFGQKVLKEAKGTITCFVSPNHHESFLALLEEYRCSGNDFLWFYPTLDSTDPKLPAPLHRSVRFLHLKELLQNNETRTS